MGPTKWLQSVSDGIIFALVIFTIGERSSPATALNVYQNYDRDACREV